MLRRGCCIIGCCYRSMEGEDNALDIPRLRALLSAYCAQRPLTAAERELVVPFMRLTLLCNASKSTSTQSVSQACAAAHLTRGGGQPGGSATLTSSIRGRRRRRPGTATVSLLTESSLWKTAERWRPR